MIFFELRHRPAIVDVLTRAAKGYMAIAAPTTVAGCSNCAFNTSGKNVSGAARPAKARVATRSTYPRSNLWREALVTGASATNGDGSISQGTKKMDLIKIKS